jgi:hypothetical protein
MENNQISSPNNQVIDLTIKSFLVEICKYLKVFYITGFVIISFFLVKTFTYTLVEPFFSPLYQTNRRLYDFIHDFYFKNNHSISTFVILIVTTSAFTYRKSLRKSLKTNNQYDLIDSFEKLKTFFRVLAVFLIFSFTVFLFSFAVGFYNLTYH